MLNLWAGESGISYSGEVFQTDPPTFLRSIRDGVVSRIESAHLADLPDKRELVEVMTEILRVCKVGAVLRFDLPYWSADDAPPNIPFNEHTFRFFSDAEASDVIEPEAMLKAGRYGLIGSATKSSFDKYVRVESIQYRYLPAHSNLPDAAKLHARLHERNVVRDFTITMRVVPKG